MVVQTQGVGSSTWTEAQRGVSVVIHEHRARPMRQDVENIDAVVVSRALATDDTILRPMRVAECLRHGSGRCPCIMGRGHSIVSVMAE